MAVLCAGLYNIGRCVTLDGLAKTFSANVQECSAQTTYMIHSCLRGRWSCTGKMQAKISWTTGYFQRSVLFNGRPLRLRSLREVEGSLPAKFVRPPVSLSLQEAEGDLVCLLDGSGESKPIWGESNAIPPLGGRAHSCMKWPGRRPCLAKHPMAVLVTVESPRVFGGFALGKVCCVGQSCHVRGTCRLH